MSHIRLVHLESDDVGAVVSVLRELQDMPRGFEQVPALPPKAKAVSAPAPEPVPALEAPKVAKTLERKLPADCKPERPPGVGDTVLAAFQHTTEPDRKQLARQLYGDDSTQSTARVGKTIWNLVNDGKLKRLPTGGYKVVG